MPKKTKPKPATSKKTPGKRPTPKSKAGGKKTRAKKTAAKRPTPTSVPSPLGSGIFLIKSEPSVYPWDELVRQGNAQWDGVRNYEARNNLRAMKKGDLCLYYHSNEGKEIVGVAKVVTEAYPDPTADADAPKAWVAVEVAPAFPLTAPVTLATLKAVPALASTQLLARPRISVVPVSREDYEAILHIGKTTRTS